MEDCEISKKGKVNLQVANSDSVVLGLLNIRSIITKVDVVYEILSEGLDILVLTETWHRSTCDLAVKMAMPPDFCFCDMVRLNDPCHGGLIVYFRSTFIYKKINLPIFKTFEALALKLSVNKQFFVLLAMYRPGSSPLSALFFDEFRSLLEHITLLGSQIVVAGDFNVHVEKTHDPNTIKLLEIFDSFKLVNRISESTHVKGGILDLIVSSCCLPVSKYKIFPSGTFSDHSLIQVNISIEKKIIKRKLRLVRSWRRLNEESFVSLVNKSSIAKPCQSDNIDNEYRLFNLELSKIVDLVAPLHYVRSRINHTAPWFDDDCRTQKRNCRKIERLYRNNRDVAGREKWILSLRTKANMFAGKRSSYWSSLIAENANCPKQLWSIVNKIICRNRNDGSQQNILNINANNFLLFFKDKVDKVRRDTCDAADSIFKETNLNCHFSTFSLCTDEDIKNVVLNSPTKSCSLDILPTHILKQHLPLFLPFITSFINLCLTQGMFPSGCKHAIVVPLLKKTYLDNSELNNYRPVSNLSFLSKIIERVVAREFLNYLKMNNLLPMFQSGYRHHHSTETALLHVLSQLFASADSQNVSLLAFLNMSAAFDCVDHDILLKKLSSNFGVTGTVKSWFKTYLVGRTQQVSFLNELSDKIVMTYGVPQGSVLGPILFLLYTADVFTIIEKYKFIGHAFADDIQIIVTSPPKSFDHAVETFVECLSEVNIWMSKNRLKLNRGKTQLLPVGTWQQLSKINVDSIVIDDCTINFSKAAANLGFSIDSNLTMNHQIKTISESCCIQLRHLYMIRKCVNKATMQTLVHAFIHSRLDYSNSLFYGVSRRSIAALQSIQNRAAKIVGGGSKFDHVTPILHELHWLTVEKRIKFKIAVLMFKCMNCLAPKYLSDMLELRSAVTKVVSLRVHDQNVLTVPSARLNIGSRSFAVAGPVVWNGLPTSLRMPGLSLDVFKKRLKTHLFKD